jgi:hypothetical protein
VRVRRTQQQYRSRCAPVRARARRRRGAEDAVAPELGRHDEVSVDVYDPEPNLTVPRARGEPVEHVVAGTVLGLRAKLSKVAVRELRLQLVAFVHGLDVGEEAIVVGDADVHAGSGVYALTVAVKVSTKIGTSSRRVVAAGSSI